MGVGRLPRLRDGKLMVQARYYAVEIALRDMRDTVCDLLAANPKLPRHIREPLECRLIDATDALNLQEPAGLK